MKRVKIMDYFAIIISIIIITVICFKVYSNGSAKLFVFIQAGNEELIFPLSIDQDISVKGPIGSTIINIKNSEIKVTDSPCRDKLCMNSKALKKNGDWTACLPNLVFISVKGKNEETTDAISF